jgi:hypothetical protein
MTQHQQINAIHESILNGQGKQAVKQMQDYSMYDFFADYSTYLNALYEDERAKKEYILQAANLYFRITNR